MVLLRIIGAQRLMVVNNLIKPLIRKNNIRNYSSAIIKSSYDDIVVPDMTLSQYVWSRSSEFEDLPAMTCGVSERSYTYGIAKMLYKKSAMALLERVKLKPGETVGVLLPNIPEYLLVVHGCLEAGLIITFANPLYTAEELGRQFQNANVKCIITIPQLLDTSLIIAKTLPNYTSTINVGGTTEANKNVLGIQELLSEDYSVELPVVKSTDIAVIPYSSGTTGLPKGVMLTHQNLVANLVQLESQEIANGVNIEDYKKETVLSVLPFFHIMGFNSILNFVTSVGGHIVSIPRFTPEDYIKCLEKFKPTSIFVVPSLILFLITHPEIKPEHLASVKRLVCGAAPATKTLIEKFIQKFVYTNCIIEQGYGMTESSPVALYCPRQTPLSKIGSCGKLLPSTEVCLIDTKSGKNIKNPLVPGEILIRGPQVMKGYLNDPKSTTEAVDPEGWLHTGDVGYYDDDGYFYIVDRTKELIKVKGNQVSPTELENIILELPGVSDVAVVGISDTQAGELPRAFIVKKPDANIDAKIVENYVTPKVAPYKKLTGGVHFIDNIPRNPSGKIIRNELRNLQV
ncbi:uncharacterized protein [Prorops nasuta]|uniref:uncharacterized protein n=1 Tax=Prorops nasuta TaxID=863751 RepID=UPI0034CF18C8